MKHPIAFSALAFVLVAFAACNGSTLSAPPTDPGAGSSGSSGGTETDGANPDEQDAAPPFDDGTPTRAACTQSFGSGLSPDHGRLDGRLVSIVGATERGCHADSAHLHLQVQMKGAIYDIAVNLDGLEGETDVKLPGVPFEEGWHPMGMDYVKDLGLHASALTVTSAATIRKRVETALAKANHISIFGTGYPGADGAHLVHYNGNGSDGAIVVNPGAPTSHVLAFRFSNDTF